MGFFVNSIPREHTIDWLLNKHYAHCVPGIMYSFGLYDENRVLQGVCCYGTPANNHNNLLGDFNCIELVRLVVNDDLPKNTLSFFVSKTLNALPKPLAVISYADKGKNHHGYIYQATNWVYTGLGGGVDFYKDKQGNEIHSRIMSDLRLKEPHKSRSQIAKHKGWDLMKGTFKHRYYFFLGDRKQKLQMKRFLIGKYKILPYPKGDNTRYDSSYIPTVNKTLF